MDLDLDYVLDSDFDLPIKPASEKEILFLRHEAPRGMWSLVAIRAEKTRSQVLYQIMQMPENQDLRVIQASREILRAITRKVYNK
ncbi:MAG: hypothetical protein EOP34_04465 [Rickettsiales bacterium]|nr:MAG: hypothetical protein EOP34_04465 [Rickettsiales bacterium]